MKLLGCFVMRALFFLALCPLWAQYPQKFRTFHSLNDPGVPAALSANPSRAPAGDVQAVAIASDGAVWIAPAPPSRGLMRYDSRAEPADRWQYFSSKRWLPDDDVRAVVPDASRGMWVRTATGVSHIELRPMTLEQKAAFFEKRVRDRHDRWGMVATSRLKEPGNLASNQTVSSDNDGLWTAMYAASQCYRWAVTRSPEALANARKAIEAVLFLEQVTGRPGFPARSYVKKSEARPADGVWHPTPDGEIQWKADTSSDEIVGHFYIFSVAWETLPDPALKQRIAATARRIMDHIVGNRYYLIDLTGQPTRWGRWSPDYFASPTGKPDAPLNALELLSFLKTTHRITGDAKYDAEYRKVAFDMKYAELTSKHLEMVEEVNYSDEELAMLSFDPLLRYEKDPQLLRHYHSALEQWWKNMSREKNPLWTYMHKAARPGAAADLDGALWILRRIPLDLVDWAVTNSGRRDIELDPGVDRFQRKQSRTLLPPDERPVMKWNGNPFRIDGGSGGRSEDDGSFFLLPYWLGRHMGILKSGD